ncbi:MAG: ATP-binding protein, partial [Dehalococcoidia bacterium]|nr:ATP-binding protein [Dehalococcoidia bacterium]
PQYANIGSIAPDGIVFASAVPTARPFDFSNIGWFKTAMSTRGFTIGDYMVGPIIAPRYTIHLAQPYSETNGQVKGVVFVALDLGWLDQRLGSAGLPAGTTLLLIDGNGVVLARYPDPAGYVGKSIAEEPLGKAVLSSQTGGHAKAAGLDGTSRLFGFVPLTLTGKGPYLAIGIPEPLAFADVSSQLRRNLIALAITIVSGAFLAFVATSALVIRPVRRLVGATRRLAEGDMEARSGMSKDRGELGQLARAFDEMGEALKQKQAETGRLNAELGKYVSHLESANKELEAFSYSVSHDLRAPLRAMSGFSQVMLDDYSDKLDEEGKRYLGIIANNAQKMGQLINDLLAFSRLSRASINVTKIDVGDLARHAFAEQAAAVPDRAIDFDVGKMPAAYGDASMMRQVLVNLIANAIKFTRPKGMAAIKIGSRVDGGENVYYVRDNGVGFDMQYLHKLFGVFQRLHREEDFEGTGVGLAIVQRIVHRHGGRVWAESVLGEGATFYFTLPGKPNDI